MKRIVIFCLCFAMCFCLIGCESSNKVNKNAKVQLEKVLDGKSSFTVHNVHIDETSETTLYDFKYPTYSDALNMFYPKSYAFIDFDGDGIEELLVVSATLDYCLFLRYEDGKVYGYVHKNISIPGIKTDGTFRTYLQDEYETISTISFSGLSSTITHKAYRDTAKGEYLLDSKAQEKDVVDKYFDDWNTNTTEVTLEKERIKES